jgi:hypothetical protein
MGGGVCFNIHTDIHTHTHRHYLSDKSLKMNGNKLFILRKYYGINQFL